MKRKRRPQSLLARPTAPLRSKRRKRAADASLQPSSASDNQQQQQQQQQPDVKKQQQQPGKRQQPWRCASEVDECAVAAISRLLRAHSGKASGASIKSLTLSPHIKAKKAVHAITCKTLQHMPVLEAAVAEAGLLAQHTRLRPAAAYVLAFEVLFGQGCHLRGPAERAVLAVKDSLKAAVQQQLAAAGQPSVQELLGSGSRSSADSAFPRTVRVNTLKLSVKEALSWLQAPAQVDAVLPDVLALPPGTDLHDHHLVLNGSLVLQSKASCMPAHALAPQRGWEVIDACAAPGNKTTHIAALLHGASRVWAFDRDPARLQRLRDNANRAGADNIVAEQADFLQVDLTAPRFASVAALLLDPSCSGSGTAQHRMDALLPSQRAAAACTERGGNSERVRALSAFQEKALRHALTLPSLRRLVYSTCSVYEQENEGVIAAVLPDAEALGFRLVKALPAWPRRGLPILPQASKLLRTDPALDGTDGFFIACFERQSTEHVK